MVFLKKKFFFLPFFNATFQCGHYGVFKKILKIFFDPEKVKKLASKVAHNRPRPFFPLSSPGHSQQPKINFPYHEISGPDICSIICGPLNIHVEQNLSISESISYHCALEWVVKVK